MRNGAIWSYCENCRSALTRWALWITEVAMMIRSCGSLWCSGSEAARRAMSAVTGRQATPASKKAAENQSSRSISSSILPCRESHSISKQEIADTKTSYSFSIRSIKKAGNFSGVPFIHHNQMWVSSTIIRIIPSPVMKSSKRRHQFPGFFHTKSVVPFLMVSIRFFAHE